MSPRRTLRFPAAAGFALALSASAAAAASDAAWSVGVAAGPAQGRVVCVEGYACDRSGAAWKADLGWRFGEDVELRLAVFGAGRWRGGDRTTAGTAFGGRFDVIGAGPTIGYRWRFAPGWSADARLGAALVRTGFDYAAPFSGSRHKTLVQPLGGIGVAWDVTPAWRIGLDYDETRFRVHRERGPLRMLGATARLSF